MIAVVNLLLVSLRVSLVLVALPRENVVVTAYGVIFLVLDLCFNGLISVSFSCVKVDLKQNDIDSRNSTYFIMN